MVSITTVVRWRPKNLKKFLSADGTKVMVQEFSQFSALMTPAPTSAELPSIAAFIAEDECGHGLVSTSSLDLRVGALILFASPAGEQVSRGASGLRHLMVPDSFFGHILAHLLQFITRHFLCSHSGDAIRGHVATEDVPPQVGVLHVLKVRDSAPDTVLILHVGVLELHEDAFLNLGSEFIAVGPDGDMVVSSLQSAGQHFPAFKAHRIGRSCRSREGRRVGGGHHVNSLALTA